MIIAWEEVMGHERNLGCKDGLDMEGQAEEGGKDDAVSA